MTFGELVELVTYEAPAAVAAFLRARIMPTQAEVDATMERIGVMRVVPVAGLSPEALRDRWDREFPEPKPKARELFGEDYSRAALAWQAAVADTWPAREDEPTFGFRGKGGWERLYAAVDAEEAREKRMRAMG